MKCWCSDFDYECIKCESEKKWKMLTPLEKIDLRAYDKQLRDGKVDLSLAERILDSDLCLTMVPERERGVK